MKGRTPGTVETHLISPVALIAANSTVNTLTQALSWQGANSGAGKTGGCVGGYPVTPLG